MNRAPLLALPALLLTSLAYACDHAGEHWKAADTDNDGIPDAWETTHGLDPKDPVDANYLVGGYTNVERYLNRL